MLPTPADWEKLRATLDRPAQIRFLAEHLRLLNCMQHGQPSFGDSYGDRQYADASPFAATKTSVRAINPYRELQGMQLAPDDLLTLLPFLTDADFLPTFGFWRDFKPDWDLHYVGMVVCPLVNAAAHRPLADLDQLNRLDKEGRQKYLGGLLDWCHANHGKTAETLMLENIRSAHNWAELEPEAALAARIKSAAALPVLAARVKDFDQYRAMDIANDCFQLGTPGLLPISHGWLDDKDQPEGVLFYAALSLVRDGSEAERREGLAALTPLLAKDDGSYYYERADDTLIDTNDETAIQLACGVLKKAAVGSTSAECLIRKLFMRGRSEALDYIVQKLASTKNAGSAGVVRNGKSMMEETTEADAVGFQASLWRTDGYQFSYDMLPPERRRKEQELVGWFKAQFERIKAGQKTNLRNFEAASADDEDAEEGP